MPGYSIVGFSSSFKVPIFAAETIFGAGAISPGSIPLTLLIVALKSSAGTATLDGTPVDIISEDDANTYAGPGSEGARMCYRALQVPGVKIKFATPTGAGGVAAAATITFATNATSAGTFKYRVAGEEVQVQVASGDTPTTIAVAAVAAFNAKTKLPVTGANTAGVVTLTVKHAGIRGNQYIIFQDTTLAPTGTTSTLGGGGTAVTGGGLTFASGTGTEDVTALLTTLFPGQYDRIAFAQNDATNLGRWKTHNNLKAGPLEGRLQHLMFGSNGSLSAATSLSATTLNDVRFEQLWLLNSESHPSELAAAMGALRTSKEQIDPDSAFDGDALTGIAPQVAVADWAQQSTQSSALDNGVTPLVTGADGKVRVSRAITTHCLNGTDPDYRTLDTSDAVVPDYVRDGLRLIWTTEFKVQNPKVASDPAEGQRDRPAGIATPARWTSRVIKYLKELEAANIVIDVDLLLPSSTYDSVARRIMSAVPVKTAPNQHQIGVSVRQQAA